MARPYLFSMALGIPDLKTDGYKQFQITYFVLKTFFDASSLYLKKKKNWSPNRELPEEKCLPWLNMTECSCMPVCHIQLLPNKTLQSAGGSVWGFGAATSAAWSLLKKKKFIDCFIRSSVCRVHMEGSRKKIFHYSSFDTKRFRVLFKSRMRHGVFLSEKDVETSVILGR